MANKVGNVAKVPNDDSIRKLTGEAATNTAKLGIDTINSVARMGRVGVKAGTGILEATVGNAAERLSRNYLSKLRTRNTKLDAAAKQRDMNLILKSLKDELEKIKHIDKTKGGIKGLEDMIKQAENKAAEANEANEAIDKADDSFPDTVEEKGDEVGKEVKGEDVTDVTAEVGDTVRNTSTEVIKEPAAAAAGGGKRNKKRTRRKTNKRKRTKKIRRTNKRKSNDKRRRTKKTMTMRTRKTRKTRKTRRTKRIMR